MQNNILNAGEVLNCLVKINNDRIRAYDYAATQTNETTMKYLFEQLAETSRGCNDELIEEVIKLGGIPVEIKDLNEGMDGAWIDIMVSIGKRNRNAIFNSCEFGETISGMGYESAISKAINVNPYYKCLIEEQYLIIKADQNKIKNLREVYINI